LQFALYRRKLRDFPLPKCRGFRVFFNNSGKRNPGHRLLASFVFFFLASVAGTSLASGLSPDGIWSHVEPSAIARTAQERQIVPQRYRSVHLSRSQLDVMLSTVPQESAVRVTESDARLWLPLPSGKFGEFRIVESPIMEPDLARRYPQIRTWLGQGVDDPTATLRFDVTPKGFRAQVISAHGTVYIDPYQPGDIDHYITYNKQDHLRGERPRCLVTGEYLDEDHDHDHVHAAESGVMVSSGENLRTYRLAMAATGEYTTFHGGTVLDGLSAIVSTMNRVNGLYERDISVRMVLVANNDLIVYTNGATDPYTNNDGFTMLGQNQSNLNAVIGNANYDIGHVVSTGGGGVASLGSVCVSSQKGRGVTGLPSPIGDSFDVDFVAHEMGHQFRGNHTFNGSGSNCSGGNRNAATAYEPGSGVTIQAYAGICGGDNLQNNSEDYFHRVSLDEMIAFTTTGSGSTCGTLTATGNTVPTVTTQAAVTIPQQTPFELSADGSDADGDTLTYIWEQFNLGNRNTTGSLVDNGGPLFRSFAPTFERTRVFPSLRYILNNANVAPATAPLPGTSSPNFFTAELLPSTNRTMNFRVTVRDNRAGGGGTNEASAAVTVTTAAGPFRVTAPNTAVSWNAGSNQVVTWDVANTNLAPVNTANVNIVLSLDGGLTWPIELADGAPNNGSANIVVPAGTPSTSRARVKVEAAGNIYFDISNADFSIVGDDSPPAINVTGSVTTRQGSPAASAVVATVSDPVDPAGSLDLSVSGAAPGLDVSVANVGGSVTLTAAAACTLVAPSGGSKVYPVLLRAENLSGVISTAFVNVNVQRNLRPTIGTYTALVMEAGNTLEHVPNTLAADGNSNLATALVTPSTLPGGGSLSSDLEGRISIQTQATTTPGVYPVRIDINDTCGASRSRQFNLTIEPPPPPGVLIVESDGSTAVAEGGAGDSYTVRLATQPTGDVTISLSHGDQVEVAPSELVFTDVNWNVPQVVSVSAVDDRVVEGAHSGTIIHEVNGADYTGVVVDNVTVNITDNDFATYAFTASKDSLDEFEAGLVLDVVLSFDTSGTGPIQLASPVTIPVNVSPQSSATGGGVDYTLSNESIEFPVEGDAQSITISLVDDAIVELDEVLILELGAATGASPGLLAAVTAGQPDTFTLTIIDDEVASVTLVESDGSTDVEEGGATDSYTLVLDAQPSGNVTVTILPDPQVTVMPTMLVFTQANWDVPQEVTVTAVDDGVIEGPHTGTITHGAVGGGYTGVSIPNVVANITDNPLVADIEVSNQLTPGYLLAGQPVVYEVTVSNLSDSVDVPELAFAFAVVPSLVDVEWTCTASTGASCPAGGSGVPAHQIGLDANASVSYVITGLIPAGSALGTEFVATATASVPAPWVDPDLTNNSEAVSATVTSIEVFEDGFEAETP